MKKTLLILMFVSLLGSLLIWWAYEDWRKGDPQAQISYKEGKYKSIFYINETDSVYTIITNMVYLQKGASLDFNRIDSCFLGIQDYKESEIKIPLLIKDSIPFPSTFNIKIFNEDMSHLIKELGFTE